MRSSRDKKTSKQTNKRVTRGIQELRRNEEEKKKKGRSIRKTLGLTDELKLKETETQTLIQQTNEEQATLIIN